MDLLQQRHRRSIIPRRFHSLFLFTAGLTLGVLVTSLFEFLPERPDNIIQRKPTAAIGSTAPAKNTAVRGEECQQSEKNRDRAHSAENPEDLGTRIHSKNNNNTNIDLEKSFFASKRWQGVAGEMDPPFRFHVYNVPERYGEGALRLLEERWPVSHCNRRIPKTNYTMLDWRHALSLFTADVWMVRYIRQHPAHTQNPKEADLFIIPIIPHVYNCAHVSHYMLEVIAHIQRLPYHRVLDQHDHYMFWWRWGLHHRSVIGFWKHIQRHMRNVKLISYELLEIMGRNDYQDFSLALKPRFLENMLHVLVPYPDFAPALQVPPDPGATRDILFYFAGTRTIGGVRRWIHRNCEAKPNICVFESFASTGVTAERLAVPQSYPVMMRRAVFCGHAAGDALSSRRPTSAVLAGCIPVIVCDLCLLPFEGIVDYAAFAVFIPEDVVIAGHMLEWLQGIPEERVRRMQAKLREVRSRFVYHSGGIEPNDALDTLVQELARRGSILRPFRRWWVSNANLSSSLSDYPVIPPSRRRYMLPDSAPGAAEFNRM